MPLAEQSKNVPIKKAQKAYQKIMEEGDKEIQNIWENLSYDQKLAATVTVFKAICQHAKRRGTFRYLIYDRLGFDTDAYAVLYSAGGMNISNEFTLAEDTNGTK